MFIQVMNKMCLKRIIRVRDEGEADGWMAQQFDKLVRPTIKM
jgi:hypothetical protein